MHILFVTDQYRRAEGSFAHGAAVHLHQLSSHLAAAGHHAEILHWGETDELADEGPVLLRTVRASGGEEFFSHIATVTADHHGPIHLNNIDYAPAVTRAPSRRVSATIHTNAFLRDPARLKLRPLVRSLDAVGVVNRAYRGALRRIRRPVLWIPSGVDADVMNPGPVRAGHSSSDFRVLLPGRPEKPKGVVFAASLLPSLAVRIGRPVTLLLTGNPDPDVAEEIRTAAGDQWPNVHFLPWREHGPAMADLYRSADAVILPSTSEACGLVLLEAMACGTPVVASPQANTSRTIRNRQTGLCAPLGSRSHWTKALTELASDTELASRLAVSGAAAVRRRHKPHEMFASYTHLFTASGALQP